MFQDFHPSGDLTGSLADLCIPFLLAKFESLWCRRGLYPGLKRGAQCQGNLIENDTLVDPYGSRAFVCQAVGAK